MDVHDGNGEIPADKDQLARIRARIDSFNPRDDADRFGLIERLGFPGVTTLDYHDDVVTGSLTLADASQLLRLLNEQHAIRFQPRRRRARLVPRDGAHQLPVAERFAVRGGAAAVKMPSEDSAADVEAERMDEEDLHDRDIVHPRTDPRGAPPTPTVVVDDGAPLPEEDESIMDPKRASKRADTEDTSLVDEDLPF